MQNIIINYDFTTGNEISFIEGCETKEDFETHCLCFFGCDVQHNVTIRNKDGGYVNNQEIMANKKGYNYRYQPCDDLLGMFIFGHFAWQKVKQWGGLNENNKSEL